MTPSPELLNELRASRPSAPAGLRARVRELAAQEAPVTAPSPWSSLRDRLAMHVIGLVAGAGGRGTRHHDRRRRLCWPPFLDAPTSQVLREELDATNKGAGESTTTVAPQSPSPCPPPPSPSGPPTPAVTGSLERAQQISATLTVEVSDSDSASDASQQALDLTQRLGGHVVGASVVTGEGADAFITLRVPVTKVQEAIVGLSGLGSIVSRRVLRSRTCRRRSTNSSGASARFARRSPFSSPGWDSESLDEATRARLQARLQNLRAEASATSAAGSPARTPRRGWPRSSSR